MLTLLFHIPLIVNFSYMFALSCQTFAFSVNVQTSQSQLSPPHHVVTSLSLSPVKLHPPRVIRGCGWKNHTLNCYHSDDGHKIEKVCQCFTDGCNQATALSSSVVGVVIAMASLLLTRA